MTILFERRLVTSLVYHVLSKLELGGDAANLHDPSGSTPAWAPALLQAYLQAGPERIELQFAGLAFEALDSLLLHAQRVATPLWARFQDALEAESKSFEVPYRAQEAEHRARIEVVAAELSPALVRLRRSLWSPREAPPLTVLHAPALGPHGRGYPRRAQHRVAVSLAQPMEHVLCQIFHEEVHPVSDRELPGLSGRDTRADTPGVQLHRRIETHAVQRGAEIIAQAMPELLPGYRRWVEGARAPR